MAENLKVTWFPREGGLSEIYQSTQIQFAFLTSPEDGSKQCHQFVLCRDFLHDAVRAEIQKNSAGIYGFHYAHGKNPPIDLHKMRMLVTKKAMKGAETETFERRMKHGLKLLNHYEKLAKWPRSTLEKVKDEKRPNIWLFIGPKQWMRSPYLVSMYTFLIRLGDKYETIANFKTTKELVTSLKKVGELQNTSGSDNDIGYIKICYNKMHVVVQHADDLLFTGKDGFDTIFYGTTNIGTFHNNCGIWSLCSSISPDKALNENLVKKVKAANGG